MRIAVSGSHRTGKSTLIEELADLLPSHVTVDEPYHQLEEEGHVFAETPSVEDFEAQLSRSISDLEEGPRDALFDRCPVDFVAYLLAHEDRDAFDLEAWLPRVRRALQMLDLIVLMGIERRDRIALSASEDDAFRLAVDEQMKELLLDDPYGLGVEVLEVEGSPSERATEPIRAAAAAPLVRRRVGHVPGGRRGAAGWHGGAGAGPQDGARHRASAGGVAAGVPLGLGHVGAPALDRFHYYASSWAWVHYLLNSQAERFADFQQRLARGAAASSVGCRLRGCAPLRAGGSRDAVRPDGGAWVRMRTPRPEATPSRSTGRGAH
ncbi:AAA family ATPase [Myxococcus sp. 1LA]